MIFPIFFIPKKNKTIKTVIGTTGNVATSVKRQSTILRFCDTNENKMPGSMHHSLKLN